MNICESHASGVEAPCYARVTPEGSRRDYRARGCTSGFKEAAMLSCRVLLEAHGTGATIYIAGHLSAHAAERTEEIVAEVAPETRVIRLDLRAVELIDPTAFVRVAGALNRWRARVRGGRITIEFPQRSKHRTPASAMLNAAGTSAPELRIPSQHPSRPRT